MPEHTAGPWIVGEPGGPAGHSYSLINQQGNVVALQIVGESNARLCGAAPDLLAAIKAMVNEVEAGFAIDVDDPRMSAAYEAIGKAETSEVAANG